MHFASIIWTISANGKRSKTKPKVMPAPFYVFGSVSILIACVVCTLLGLFTGLSMHLHLCFCTYLELS